MKTSINMFNEEKQVMKTFFQLREELTPVNEANRKDIESYVSDRHGLNADHHKSSKGFHAVAVEPDHRGGKMGKSSLGDHDSHSHHVIVHQVHGDTHVKLRNGKKATAADVAKQAPKAPASIHNSVANYHNMGEK